MVPVVGHCDEEELADFAHAEMAGADFGDERINRRASKIVSSFAARPQSSIPAASEDWAGAKGAYRFFSNPRVTPEKILEPHLDKAVERCAGEDLVLAIGDTTLLDFTSRKATSGTGPLSGCEPHGLGPRTDLEIVSSAAKHCRSRRRRAISGYARWRLRVVSRIASVKKPRWSRFLIEKETSIRSSTKLEWNSASTF